MRALNVTPHIAQNISGRRSAVDGRTTRHAGYAVSQRKRKRIEEPFGWGKTIGGLARPMLRGVEKLGFKFTLTMAGYNLIRLPKLIAAVSKAGYSREKQNFSSLLILLCHKFRCLLRAAQHGQRESVVTRAATNLRRIVAIEFGTWRSGRNGGLSGLITFA